MDTVYEKTCPACGKATTLAAKFCSGCGHQFRTVFHDSDTADVPAAASSGFQFDARWAPVLAVIPVVLVVLVFANPGRQTPVQSSGITSTSTTVVTSTSDDIGNLITRGMRPLEVRQKIGEDYKIIQTTGANPSEEWIYVRGNNVYNIHFNSNDIVDSWSVQPK